jgi:hypothetical protein
MYATSRLPTSQPSLNRSGKFSTIGRKCRQHPHKYQRSARVSIPSLLLHRRNFQLVATLSQLRLGYPRSSTARRQPVEDGLSASVPAALWLESSPIPRRYHPP